MTFHANWNWRQIAWPVKSCFWEKCFKMSSAENFTLSAKRSSHLFIFLLSWSYHFICTAHIITNTCLYSFDPLKPHFYIVKLGFTGVYIIFHISAQKHRLWVLVRTASSTDNLCFQQKYEKYQNFLSENFHFFFCGKIFSIFE